MKQDRHPFSSLRTKWAAQRAKQRSVNTRRIALLVALSSICVTLTLAPARSQLADSNPADRVALTVHIRDLSYKPDTAKVHVGDTVLFVNDDEVRHDVSGGVLKSGDLDRGKSWRYTFDKPATYAYMCTYHPWMKGSIIAE
jgi:plastocyanin